jgi:hypothetical protein
MLGKILFAVVVIYLTLTIVFFGVTAIAAEREVRARLDFRMTLFGGTYNVYRYYKHLKMKEEAFSTTFKLFLWAHLNFALCVVVFVAYVVWLVKSNTHL